MKSERDKIAAKARKLCSDPTTAAEWRAAWTRVLDRLDAWRWCDDRPALNRNEIRHFNETARETMLRGLIAGKPIVECEELAFQAVMPPCPISLPEA